METLGTRRFQHGFKPRHSTASGQLPISARVVSGFSQRKLPSRTIAVAVDISKAFDTVSHRLLNEMIHRFRLRHNLVRKASCLYQQHHSTLRQVRAGSHREPSSPQPSPTTLDYPIPELDMTSYAGSLYSQHRGGRVEGKPTMFFSDEVGRRQAIGHSLLPRNPAIHHCSPLTPTSPDSTLRWESMTRWPNWTELLKSWVSRWTSSSPSALTPAIVASGLRGLIMSCMT